MTTPGRLFKKRLLSVGISVCTNGPTVIWLPYLIMLIDIRSYVVYGTLLTRNSKLVDTP